MKILCVSDFVDPLIYNQNVKEVFSDIDAVLCAGDLPLDYVDFIVSTLNKPTFWIFGNHNLNEYKYYHSEKHLMPHQMTGRYGETKHFHGGTYLGFKTIEYPNLSFTDPENGKKTPLLIAGVNGSLKYNNGLCQYTDAQMKRRLIRMIPKLIRNKIKYGRYLDIFLTHASPRHIHDHEDPCHKGFDCFNWFLQKFKPALMIHGHIHLYDMREERIGKYYDTVIINAYSHIVLTFDSPKEFKFDVNKTNVTQ